MIELGCRKADSTEPGLQTCFFVFMSYFRYIILLFVLLQANFIPAQSKSDNAKQNIITLKDGALFVRLKTSENLINALNAKGKKEQAELVKAEQLKKNQEIANAFASNFTFCKVYFFYSNNSTKIKEGNYSGCLLNTKLEVDTSFTGNNYLIGEFDESETTSIAAFIIKDKKFVQLKPPFPFLIRLNKVLVIERSKEEIVKELDRRLFLFLSEK